MVVPRWSPLRLASAALAVLFLPLAAATPEVRDPSQATAFVDGASDYFEFAPGEGTTAGVVWTLTAPDGATLAIARTGTGTGTQPTSFYLDGRPRAGNFVQWRATGSLAGAAADGTWLVQNTHAAGPAFVAPPVYISDDVDDSGSTPGPTLSVRSKAAHWGVNTFDPTTVTQAWNWHETVGTWSEPSTLPNTLPTVIDSPNEARQEDPQFARFFAPAGGPAGRSIPGASDSETIPGQDIDTPPFTLPATCTAGPCDAETPLGSTPSETVPEQCTLDACNEETPLVTPGQPVGRTCAPLDVVCLGPFSVPPQDLGDAPAVCDAAVCLGPITVPSQDLGDAPAVCDVAGDVCVGPIPVPAQDVVETQPITVAVGFTGLDVLADPHAAELTSVGPFDVVVPVPVIGDVPVTVCASTCPFPVSPEGETVGSVTVTVTVGAEEHSVTVPLGSSV